MSAGYRQPSPGSSLAPTKPWHHAVQKQRSPNSDALEFLHRPKFLSVGGRYMSSNRSHQTHASTSYTTAPPSSINSTPSTFSRTPATARSESPARRVSVSSLVNAEQDSPLVRSRHSFAAGDDVAGHTPITGASAASDTLHAQHVDNSPKGHFQSGPTAWHYRTAVSPLTGQQRPSNSYLVPHGSAPSSQYRNANSTNAPRSPATNLYSPPSHVPSRDSARAPLSIPQPAVISEPPAFDYDLTVRQQPIAARACGFGERDRRVIDPPPILELKITDRVTLAPVQDLGVMLAVQCEIFKATTLADSCHEYAPPELPPTRRLMGTTVASPYQAKDDHGVAGTFFVFSDLSCRSPGKYRLRFRLLRVDLTLTSIGTRHPVVAGIETDAFSVYAAKDFPGMRASTALLRALRGQGLNVGLKKGTEARRKSTGLGTNHPSDESAESESDRSSGSDSADGEDKKRKKRLRRESPGTRCV